MTDDAPDSGPFCPHWADADCDKCAADRAINDPCTIEGWTCWADADGRYAELPGELTGGTWTRNTDGSMNACGPEDGDAGPPDLPAAVAAWLVMTPRG